MIGSATLATSVNIFLDLMDFLDFLGFLVISVQILNFEVSKQGNVNVRIKDFLIFVHIESGAEFSGLESSNNCKRQQSCVPNRPSVSTITLRVEKSGKRTNKSFLKQTNSS